MGEGTDRVLLWSRGGKRRVCTWASSCVMRLCTLTSDEDFNMYIYTDWTSGRSGVEGGFLLGALRSQDTGARPRIGTMGKTRGVGT